MADLEWPYTLPIWQRSLRLASPNGRMWAEIEDAVEVSMGNPTMGTLVLPNGSAIERCNPSFLWSDDSNFVAVAQYTYNRFLGIGKQHLLVIDVNENRAWRSQKLAYYIQPEEFQDGKVSVILNPFKTAERKAYSISEVKETFTLVPSLPKQPA